MNDGKVLGWLIIDSITGEWIMRCDTRAEAREGGKEMRAKTSPRFYRDIARLIRPADDLNLLCRVCNAAHYLESKYGELPFLIVWGARRVR